MKIDAYATMDHYFEHVVALHRHLEPDHRGSVYMGSYDLCGAAGRTGIIAQAMHPPRSERPILVASWTDAARCLRVGRKVILMEHGAGQSYAGVRHPSYSGAPEHANVVLRLVPNEYAAERHRAAHPNVPVEVIGCPKLDDLIQIPHPGSGRVALGCHWGKAEDTFAPEMAGAWFAWHEHFDAIPKAFPGALGHAHPKLWNTTHKTLADKGFEPVRWFSDVVRRADVYVIDNSSTMFEFAALDRPVVVLNPPHYRRDVNHGGRFWDWADVGVQVDDPADIPDAIRDARWQSSAQVQRRREVVAEVYPNLGNAGLVGAKAITEFFD